MAPALSKVAAGSSSQPPKAASEPDCTAKHADAADCSDKVMAAQCANGQVMCFSRKCCLCATAGGRPANARSVGYDHHKGEHTHMRATLPPKQAVVYERFAAGTCR